MRIRTLLLFVVPVALVSVVVRDGSAAFNPVFREDFEEATLGGGYDYTGPTDTTGISPDLGTWATFINDNGVITNGLAGSARALFGKDERAGLALRNIGGGFWVDVEGQVYFDFMVSGPLSGNSLQFLLSALPSGGGTYLLGLLLLPDMTLYATDSTNGLFNNVTTVSLTTNKEYRVFLEPNLITDTYSLTVSNLTDAVNVSTQTGLDFIPNNSFRSLDIQYGTADFGGAPAGVFIDNIEVHNIIPEPSAFLLLGVGGWCLWRHRRP